MTTTDTLTPAEKADVIRWMREYPAGVPDTDWGTAEIGMYDEADLWEAGRETLLRCG